jgi:hypothetical protein
MTHSLTPGYDSVDRVVTVTVPGRTLADALAETPAQFEEFADAMADAALVVESLDESSDVAWESLFAAREQLAQEISGGDPERKGREVKLDPTRAIQLAMDLLAVVVDRGLVHDTATVTAAWSLIGRVRNDEQIAELVHRKEMAARVAKAAA